MSQITSFLEEVRATLITAGSIIAVIGVISLGCMYALSATPILSEWRQNNPKAFNDVVKGIVIISVAASGGVAALFGL